MDNEKLINDLKTRLLELKTERSKFESKWKTAERFIAPVAYNWDDLDAIPEPPKRFASDPCKYLNTLVAGLVGYSVSPSIKWFALSLEKSEQLDIAGVKDWLENVQQIMVSEFNRSNLYKMVTPWIRDGMTLGHGSLLCDENLSKNSLRFSHQRANEIYLDVNADGEVDTVFRTFTMTIRQIVGMFGYDNLPEEVQFDYDEIPSRSKKHEILFAVYPREEYSDNTQFSDKKAIAAVYIDLTKNKILQISGYDEFPYAVYEYSQITGYAYSSSIADEAIEEVKSLNVCKDTQLKIAQTAAEPPMKASDHLKNISIRPKAINLLRSPTDVVDVIRTGENYPITIDVVREIKQTVRDIFNVDFFLMLQSQQGKVMTATEVMELQGEKAAVLSDLIVSLNNALETIISRSFNILMRAGKLPEPPEGLLQTNDMATIKIEFEGPLAQAQKKYYAAGTAQQSLAAAAPVLQVFPNAADYIDPDKLIVSIMESTGMPQSVIREKNEVTKIREARLQQQQEQMQMQMQMEQQKNLLQNANKLNEPIEKNSIISQLNQQLAGGLNNA